MSRKVNRKLPNTLSSFKFMPGISYNGQVPLMDEGDQIEDVLFVRCHCGAALALVQTVFRFDRSLPPLHLITTQEMEGKKGEDSDARGIVRLLEENSNPPTSCPADGVMEINSKAILKRIERRVPGTDKPKTFYLPRRV